MLTGGQMLEKQDETIKEEIEEEDEEENEEDKDGIQQLEDKIAAKKLKLAD